MKLRGIGFGLAAALLVVLLAAPDVRAGLGGYHEDERIGFKIRTPQDWERIPSLSEEKWVVGQYMSDKSDFYTDPTDGWTWEFKPRMTMIAFIDEVVRKKLTETTEKEDGKVRVDFGSRYKDYKEYLRATYSGGGWYVSEEVEGDIRGVSVEMLEIKVEKLASTGPKRIVTWIYDLEDVKLAVQFEVLEGEYDKQKRDIYGSLKSFKTIQRTEELLPATTGESGIVIEDESKLTPAERAKRRAENEVILRRKARESVPDDWEVLEIGPFLVLNHADKKYAKELCSHVEAVWKWLDENLAYVGANEYVTAPIIRICKDQEEQNALFGGSTVDSFIVSALSGRGIEITTYKDTSEGSMSWAWEKVNRQMLSIWFSQRDGDLYSALPRWLDSGFDQVLGTARAKGRGLEFKPDQWELEGLRQAARDEALIPPRDLMTLTGSDFWEQQASSHQAAAFLRFLLEARDRKTRQVLEDYLLSLKAVITEMDEKEKAAEGKEDKPPETEEEEEERFRKRKEAWREREEEILKATLERTFGKWDDRDWKRLEKLYYKSVD